MKKTLLYILTILLFFSNTVVIADAEVVIDLSDDNTINNDIRNVLPDPDGEDIEHTHFKLTTANKIAYCSEGRDKNPDKEDSIWNNCKTLTGGNSISLAYIYENGYGSYKESYTGSDYLVGGNKYTDYFITQVAVWAYTSPPAWYENYFDPINHTYHGQSNDATEKISKLINDANAAQSGPTLEITSNEAMALTLVGDYYVSKGIKLSGTYLNNKITVSVSGPTGAFVTTDSRSTTGSTLFENDSTIYVKIPVNSVVNVEKIDFSLTASSTSAIGEGKIIECEYSNPEEYSDYEIQNIIIYNPGNDNVTANANFSVSTINIKILKKDSNGEMLDGATLTVKQGDTVIQSWVTGINAREILLVPGTYTLTETKTPAGYVVNNDIITFVVRNNGNVYVNDEEVEEIVIVNDPITINVAKRTIKEDGELSGATLRITDIDGNIAKDIKGNNLEWVTSDNPKSFHVAAGTYILEEIEAPEGYELSDEKIEFIVKEDGTVVVEEGFLSTKEIVLENNLIIFENIPEAEDVQTGSVVLYIAICVGTIAIGITLFLVLKKYKK